MRIEPPSLRRQTVAIGLFLAAATVFNTYPQAFHLSSAVGSHGDALFSVWRLSWVAHAIVTAPFQLFDANIFYPQRGTLAYSDALLLPAITAAPLQWSQLPPVLVYNVVLLATFFLSALSACLFVRWLTGSLAGGLIAGMAFAFSSHQLEHFDRLDVQLTFFIPLALWAIHRIALRGRWRDGLILGALVTGQIYSGIYNGVFLVTFIACVAPLVILVERRSTTRSTVPIIGVSLIVALLAAIPYLLPYLHNRIVLGDRSVEEIQAYSATYGDFLHAHLNNVVYGTTLGLASGGSSERFLFPGVLLVALAACGIRPRARPMSLVYLAGFLFAFEMSRGLNSALYTWWHDHVFIYRGLRAPARFDALVQLTLGVLAGFGVDRVRTAITTRRMRAAVLAALMIGVAVEYWGRPELRAIENPSPIYKWLRRQPPGPVLVLPAPEPDRLFVSHDVNYMVDSIGVWYPLLNGQSGFFPQSYLNLIGALRTFPSREAVEYAVNAGARYVLIYERYMPDTYRRVIAQAAVSPRLSLVARYPDGTGEIAVYRVGDAPP